MRVYVPLTLPGLAEAHKTGELGSGPFVAYAVTPALREWCRTDDMEELEYAALSRAALASLRRLAADAGAPRRRTVVAVDVSDSVVRADSGAGAEALGEVTVTAAVPLAKAAAVHVDADDAEEDVAAAAGALEAADGGDDDARAVVEDADDHELLWYATQEIPHLVR